MARSKKTTVDTSTLTELKKKAAAAEQRSKENQALESRLAQMQAELDAAKSGSCGATRKSSKVKKQDLNEDLQNHVISTAKTVLFQTVKFIEDELEEEEVTEEIIPFLPVDIGMGKEHFVKLYSGCVYDGIKAGRTDVQSNGKKTGKR